MESAELTKCGHMTKAGAEWILNTLNHHSSQKPREKSACGATLTKTVLQHHLTALKCLKCLLQRCRNPYIRTPRPCVEMLRCVFSGRTPQSTDNDATTRNGTSKSEPLQRSHSAEQCAWLPLKRCEKIGKWQNMSYPSHINILFKK